MTIKRRIYISIMFFTGITILLIIFVIYPLFLEIKKNSQDFFNQKQRLAILEKKIENLKKIRIFFPEISPGLEKIDNFLVNPEMPTDFIKFLEKASQDFGLSLKISLGPLVKTEKDPWSSLLFQLSLAGSFANFSKFLEKLESTFYLIEIQNMTISRLSENELKLKEFEMYSLGDIKAILSIKVYTK